MKRILVFDSGVGGLTIVDEIRRQAEGVAVDYAADAEFFPYGIRSDEELRQRLPDLCARLIEVSNADMLVVGCNTASTLALDAIRAQTDCPVIGTVPAVAPAARATKTGVFGVLATPGTVRRAYLDDLERDHANGMTMLRQGSAELVKIAEAAASGEVVDGDGIQREVTKMFTQPNGDKVDVLVLACTHFPLVREQIQSACPDGVTLIDTGEAVARQAVKRMSEIVTDNPSDGAGTAYLTGASKDVPPNLYQTLGRFGFSRVECLGG